MVHYVSFQLHFLPGSNLQYECNALTNDSCMLNHPNQNYANLLLWLERTVTVCVFVLFVRVFV